MIYFNPSYSIPNTDDEKKAIHLEKAKKAKEAFRKKVLKKCNYNH